MSQTLHVTFRTNLEFHRNRILNRISPGISYTKQISIIVYEYSIASNSNKIMMCISTRCAIDICGISGWTDLEIYNCFQCNELDI